LEGDEEDLYETQGGYWPVEANDDDFWGGNKKMTFWQRMIRLSSKSS